MWGGRSFHSLSNNHLTSSNSSSPSTSHAIKWYIVCIVRWFVVACVDGSGVLELVLVKNDSMKLTIRKRSNMFTLLCILDPLPPCTHHKHLPIIFDCCILCINQYYWSADGFASIEVEFSSSWWWSKASWVPVEVSDTETGLVEALLTWKSKGKCSGFGWDFVQ